MRKFLGVCAVAALTAGSAPALAAPCKDPNTGKFVKCPPAALATDATTAEAARWK